MRTAKFPFAFAARAQRAVLFLLLLFLPLAALADGIVVPSIAYPATVTIPDQRALICFSNGTERLVVETRFTGAGTNFAWVVPFPAQPVVEQATTGIFPTLQYLFRPEIVTDAPQYFPWISGLIWIGYVLLFVRPTGRISWLDIASCLLVAMCIASAHGTYDGPRGAWISLGVIAFIFLLLILALLRHWRADMHRLAVALTALFIAVQLIPVFGYVTSPSYYRPSLLDQPVFWFFLWIDIMLILALAISKETGRIVCAVLLLFLFLFVAAGLLLPVLGAGTRSASLDSAEIPDQAQAVSVLQRKIVGIFDTTTIASSDPTALQNWLTQNGYSVPANAGPIIADYVKGGWVFVATKIRRDAVGQDALTPHPLSFTFNTDKPVYPMRLTGLASKTLSVDLYVFSNMRAAAPHFRTESCTQPAIGHPLLANWTAGLPVATKLSATLTANDMRQDVWLGQSSFAAKQSNRMYGPEAVWTIALNRGAGFFGIGLVVVSLVGFLATRQKGKIPALVTAVTIASLVIVALSWLSLPRTGLRWVRGGQISRHQEMLSLLMALQQGNYPTLAAARADAQTMSHFDGNTGPWENVFTGEPVHEEDSPGNYMLQVTNNQLQLVTFDADGRPDVTDVGPLKPSLDASKN